MNAPIARYLHNALWTGSEMIIWGGSDRMNLFAYRRQVNPNSDSWTADGAHERAARPGRSRGSMDW